MQLCDVNYYSDVLISMHRDILKGHWDGGRVRTKCILINHCINKGGPARWMSLIAGGKERHLPSCSALCPTPLFGM